MNKACSNVKMGMTVRVSARTFYAISPQQEGCFLEQALILVFGVYSNMGNHSGMSKMWATKRWCCKDSDEVAYFDQHLILRPAEMGLQQLDM